jgi:hypothetical protein
MSEQNQKLNWLVISPDHSRFCSVQWSGAVLHPASKFRLLLPVQRWKIQRPAPEQKLEWEML